MKKLNEMIVINPKKFKRRLLFGLIIFGLVLLVFPSVTYADFSDLFGESAYTRSLSDLIRMISHIVYVFIWPCLVIAGTALDNSLIFGKFLHLDAALWNIWNIMKNFANFALGFLFVFSIIVNLFKGVDNKSDPMKNAVGTIKSTLIAGVLVQMSWFLVAALIDLSTILVYAVGGLPLSMLGTYNKDVADIPIMRMNTEITNDDVFYYYSYGNYNFSPCFLVNKDGDVNNNIRFNNLSGEYIAGRERMYLSSGEQFEPGYCTLNGYLYKYKESSGFFCEGGENCYSPIGNTLAEKNSGYKNLLVSYLDNISRDTGLVEDERNSCFLINAYGIDYVPGGTGCTPLCPGYGAIVYTGDIFADSANVTGSLTLKELLNKSKGWVGPFVTMYSSILNYQELVMNPGNESTMGTLFGFLINTFFALILFLPMAILAVLLIIRVGYLWVVVAISPILVLVHTFAKFGGDGPLKNLANNDIFKKFGIKEIMTQIFAPVIVVFAVSLCIVFLSTIYKSKPNEDDASRTLNAFGIQKVQCAGENEGDGGENSCPTQKQQCSYSILGLVTIKMNAQNYNHGKDMFVWVLMELLATGIVWFFMKFAINMMGDRGKELMKIAEKFVTTLPVLQLPGVEGRVGLHALGIGRDDNPILNNLNSKVLELTRFAEQDEALHKRFSDKTDNNNSSSGTVPSAVSEAVEYIRNNKVTDYNNLNKKYQDALATVGYNSGNFGDFYRAISAENYGDLLKTTPASGGSVGHTNSEAVMYSKDQLDAAVRTDNTRKAWASGMVAGSVQTSDGVYIVDYLDGKANQANPGNQQYEIVDRDTYEKRHFGDQTVNMITKDIYDKNQEDIDKYLKELKDELAELKKLEDKKTNASLSQSEAKQYEILKKLSDELSGKSYTLDDIKNGLGL